MAINIYIFSSPGDVLAGEASWQNEALLEVDHQRQKVFSIWNITMLLVVKNWTLNFCKKSIFKNN